MRIVLSNHLLWRGLPACLLEFHSKGPSFSISETRPGSPSWRFAATGAGVDLNAKDALQALRLGHGHMARVDGLVGYLIGAIRSKKKPRLETAGAFSLIEQMARVS